MRTTTLHNRILIKAVVGANHSGIKVIEECEVVGEVFCGDRTLELTHNQ